MKSSSITSNLFGAVTNGSPVKSETCFQHDEQDVIVENGFDSQSFWMRSWNLKIVIPDNELKISDSKCWVPFCIVQQLIFWMIGIDKNKNYYGVRNAGNYLLFFLVNESMNEWINQQSISRMAHPPLKMVFHSESGWSRRWRYNQPSQEPFKPLNEFSTGNWEILITDCY